MIHPSRTGQSGLSLVEMSIAMSCMALVGYLLSMTMQVSTMTHTTVMQSVSNLESLRNGTGSLRSSLRSASASVITVTTLDSGDSELTLQEPIVVGGEELWGVYELDLGTDDATRTRQNWSIRFTVDIVPEEDGGQRHDLVRQVMDDLGVVQLAETLIWGLYQGDAGDPGFQVLNVGEVWETVIQTAGVTNNTKGQSTVFHARTRN